MLVLMSMMVISFTACSSDDDDVDPTQQYKDDILGGWYYDDYEYWFSSGGTGEYRCEDIMGDFHYTVDGQGIQMRQFTYWNSATGSIWDGEDMNAYYNPEKNTLYIDGKTFTRNKPSKPAEDPVDSVATE